MRLVLSLLLVLTACSAAPADPVALIDGWREVMRKQKSVRLDVRTEVDGKHPRTEAYAGVLHFSWMGGTPQWDVTAHVENRYGTTDYRSMRVHDDEYLSHSDLTLPPGKEFSSMELNDALWVGTLSVELSLAQREYSPSGAFSEIDRKTVRLVEHDGDRYVFAAGGVPHSGGFTDGDVRLVVEVDDENRPVRVERSAPTVDEQTERFTAVYSQWGTAPDVLRPPQEVVAKPKDVAAQRR
ncbi:hypothetical protein [Lentzea sp. NEAU-D7]|uniref:hypothetical protein n=1 Tax=Lentzea sp. NEAU-D7 TaxID=2994667 RepID=UPI00224AFA88|nr:hypothetical protein [Lentzea sp. NEAU-D7]MCX2950950.1 hypothetical protein [Lentzea sp. NEAU-D7]